MGTSELDERRPRPAVQWPRLGFGAGLRAEHYEDVLSGPPEVEWFEAISENYMETGGRPLAVLESVRRDYPVALHGVSLSIGGADRLDVDDLGALEGDPIANDLHCYGCTAGSGSSCGGALAGRDSLGTS